MKKVSTLAEVANYFHNGMTVMVGGFMGIGTPTALVQLLLDEQVSGITLISSDTAMVDRGVGRLVAGKRLRKIIASHIGTNPETGRQMIAGEVEVELVPQGTFAERIRCGGAGLGGFLTPTGVGTSVAEGKELLMVNGRHYLLEYPIRAEVALLKAHQADRAGNLIYRNSARNFNPMMALAADIVIAEVEEIVGIGALDPNAIVTPGILVDYLVCTGGA